MYIGNLATCLFAGALGGALYHLFWMIKTGQTSKTIPPTDSQHRNFRAVLLLLSVTAGVTAAFLVFLWHYNELQLGVAELNKVAVLSAIAGLSGESLLGLLRKVANV